MYPKLSLMTTLLALGMLVGTLSSSTPLQASSSTDQLVAVSVQFSYGQPAGYRYDYYPNNSYYNGDYYYSDQQYYYPDYNYGYYYYPSDNYYPRYNYYRGTYGWDNGYRSYNGYGGYGRHGWCAGCWR